jgi:hypothetical protein
VVALRQVVELGRHPLLCTLLRRVDVKHVGAAQVALHKRQLLLLDPALVPPLQQLDQQPQAGRGVGGGGGSPEREEFTVSI